MAKIRITETSVHDEDFRQYSAGGHIEVDGVEVFRFDPDITAEPIGSVDLVGLLKEAAKAVGLNLTVKVWYDSSDCETCGMIFDEGGRVSNGNRIIFEYKPVASCFSSRSLSEEQLWAIGLVISGHEVEFADGDDPNIQDAINEYRASRS